MLGVRGIGKIYGDYVFLENSPDTQNYNYPIWHKWKCPRIRGGYGDIRLPIIFTSKAATLMTDTNNIFWSSFTC
jgi:hypothetical protein